MRAGLEQCGIETVWANDIDQTKASLYRENWGSAELHVKDIRDVSGVDVPRVDLATASFPCVDLSLAGNRAGLNGTRSGLIWEFCRIVEEMSHAPDIIVIENVPGFLTANGGRDFDAVASRLNGMGYHVSHISIDAAAFVPQRRLRVFMVCFRDCNPLLPPAPPPKTDLRLNLVAVDDAEWWETRRLADFLLSLSDVQAAKVDSYARRKEDGHYGAYRRTRQGSAVWEVRSDEIAGALRTTQGGSSRQAILRAGGGGLAARWMDVREYAALQGADGISYESVSPRQAMYAFGDAVCVPAIEWLANNCILPFAGHA